MAEVNVYYLSICFLFPIGGSTDSFDDSGSTATSKNHSILSRLESEHTNSNANNDNSNWFLIFLVIALFVAAILMVVLIALQWWSAFEKKKREHKDRASERQLLLYDQDVEIIEGHPQPSPKQNSDWIEVDTSVSIPVKQQLSLELTERVPPQYPAPKGLVNLGNTCFFNSMLQSLQETHLLEDQLCEQGCPGELTCAFKEFLYLMRNDNRTSLSPKKLFKVFSGAAKRFADGSQHDSHECLRHFLDELRKEERRCWNNAVKMTKDKQPTVIDKLFGGHFITFYTCQECITTYHVCEPFLDISLPIVLPDCFADEVVNGDQPERINSTDEMRDRMSTSEVDYLDALKSVATPLSSGSTYEEASTPKPHSKAENHSIADCLRHFTRRESLTTEYLCINCNNSQKNTNNNNTAIRLTSATKQTLILNSPALLTIHLKRFEQKNRGFVKCNRKIGYEELLNISPFCSSSCLGTTPRDENIWYALYAVIVHAGSLSSGHYIAYVKARDRNQYRLKEFIQKEHFDRNLSVNQLLKLANRGKEQVNNRVMCRPETQKGVWYRVDDSTSCSVNADEVLDQNAYLLFYERI